MQVLNLNGSVDTVTEFFEVCLNSILFQRQLYPAEFFQCVMKWGLPQMMAINSNLKSYFQKVVQQLRRWLETKSITEFTLTILDSNESAIESWQFSVHIQEADPDQDPDELIRAVLRQIGMSVTFLPVLTDNEYSIRLSVRNCDTDTPEEWAESDARVIENPYEVTFKSIQTQTYSVGVAVQYKRPNL